MPGPQPGSIEGFHEVYRYIREAMARVSSRWLSQEIEELAHRAACRLLERSRVNGHQGGFKPAYLNRVAYTTLVDEIRRRRPLVPIDAHVAANGDLVSCEGDPEQACRLSELREAMAHCLGAMIENRRRAMVLLLLGHSIGEIAALMRWNVKQAENNVTRGRSDLRDCLQRRGHRK
ncbi:MAG TPA: sigma-70 family RNA polymerase sigma factor [Candidatus Polarisedimenticolia bacterium]|nr:sigma-70 family RNA polymerase sigma factor [Candidatus Polarisedimenticolia bacterium]